MTHNRPRDIAEPTEDQLSEFGKRHVTFGKDALDQHSK